MVTIVRRVDRVAKQLKDGDGLEAAAKRLAQTLHDPDTPPAAQASIARELRMILLALENRPQGGQGDGLDELTARRKARRAG